jgi:hypothetical protein
MGFWSRKDYDKKSGRDLIREAADKRAEYERQCAERPYASADTRRKWRKTAGLEA